MPKNSPVLLVEDNSDDEVLVQRSLNTANLKTEIVVARDGAEALDYLFATGAYADRDREQLPVVVLLDLKLPRIDGLEVLRRIRADERMKLLPVIVLTSSDEDKDVADSYRLGANSYIQKPVNYGEFSTAVQGLGLYWLWLNKVPSAVHAPPCGGQMNQAATYS